MAVNWSYYDKFDDVLDKYLPKMGEGLTVGSQIATAVAKLVYKWYNDGDVYDNQGPMQGWCNDLSSYANWLRANTDCGDILDKVYDCFTDSDYEDLLKELADKMLDPELLRKMDTRTKVGSVYKCEGPYVFEEYTEDDDYYTAKGEW